MNFPAALRSILNDLDIPRMRTYASEAEPHMPSLGSDFAVEARMHYARTLTQTIVPRKRFYSHRWLFDHDLPSGLPDRLKPAADRMYPRIVEGVAICCASASSEVALSIRSAMERVVLESFADDERDPGVVRLRMMDARDRERRGLGLRPAAEIDLIQPWKDIAQ